ncbi:sugar nucleotide-binding protein [Micrococcales bacterium 31B]|nr:sugar nucleotide-binding protein [Micrococcales bacterium 31B]
MAAELRVEPTPIPGLLVVHLPVHGDNRGWFKENWNRAKMTALGLPDFGPVQNNISFNAEPGVIRGMHAEPWDKFISVASGRVFGAWVDLREGDTFGAVFTHEIGPDTAIFVPRGVGNGFQCLEANTAYAYLVNDHWSQDAVARYAFVNLADETLNIAWPLPIDESKLSQADIAHPRLAQVKPFARARYAVIGARGQLGRALIERLGERAVAVDRDELDITDAAAVAAFDFSQVRGILNASGYTQVDAAETDSGRSAAWAINATAVGSLARAAAAHRLPLVHVSTDYVFAGDQADVTPEAPLAPRGVYAQSKAAGELAVSSAPGNSVVRTSWLYGDGNNFVRTMVGLAERGIKPGVVDDQVGRLTYAGDLADFLLHLLDNPQHAGTYNFSNGGAPASWCAIAREVFRLSGANADDVTAVTTDEYGAGKQLAPRPALSSFNLDAVAATGFDIPDQMQRLAEYVAALRMA